MTPTQFRRKYRELANQAHARLLEKAEAAIKSGAIEFGDFANDYALPMIVLTTALESAVYDWLPVSPAHRKHVENLACFI
jgi:hypothetical protein